MAGMFGGNQFFGLSSGEDFSEMRRIDSGGPAEAIGEDGLNLTSAARTTPAHGRLAAAQLLRQGGLTMPETVERELAAEHRIFSGSSEAPVEVTDA